MKSAQTWALAEPRTAQTRKPSARRPPATCPPYPRAAPERLWACLRPHPTSASAAASMGPTRAPLNPLAVGPALRDVGRQK